MKLIDSLRISLRMIQTKKLRAVLTITGIGIAVGLIVFLIGLGYGLQEMTIGSIVRAKNLYSIDVLPPADTAVAFTQKSTRDIKDLDGVEAVSPVISTSAEATILGKVGSTAMVSGNSAFLEMEGIGVHKGRVYSDGASEVVVSPQLLDLIDVDADRALGSTISFSYPDPANPNNSLSAGNVEIVGISQDTDLPTMFAPIDLIAPTDTVTLTSVKVLAESAEQVTALSTQLNGRGYQVETLIDTLNQARSVFRWVTIALFLLGMIAVIIAGVGMFNTMTIALLERTKDFGIMKAIGLTDSTIRRLFLTEAGIIGLVGGIVGIAAALLGERGIQTVLNSVIMRYGGDEVVLFQHPVGFLPAMILFPLLLGLFTGIYPAVRASKLNPLKALRYE